MTLFSPAGNQKSGVRGAFFAGDGTKAAGDGV
jgi:hypothetical protein